MHRVARLDWRAARFLRDPSISQQTLANMLASTHIDVYAVQIGRALSQLLLHTYRNAPFNVLVA